MLFARGLPAFLAFLLWVYALFDAIAAESSLVRNLPKMAWIFLVLFFGPIGALAWIILGRPEGVGWRPGSSDYSAPRRPIAPEDEPDFIQRMEERRRLQAWEEDLRRREDELRRDRPEDGSNS
jgi:hypothetical protein